jgi:hypothetical protein
MAVCRDIKVTYLNQWCFILIVFGSDPGQQCVML